MKATTLRHRLCAISAAWAVALAACGGPTAGERDHYWLQESMATKYIHHDLMVDYKFAEANEFSNSAGDGYRQANQQIDSKLETAIKSVQKLSPPADLAEFQKVSLQGLADIRSAVDTGFRGLEERQHSGAITGDDDAAVQKAIDDAMDRKYQAISQAGLPVESYKSFVTTEL